jgi:hypothetical protein
MRPPTVGANPADTAAPTLIRWRETDDQRQRAIGRPIAGLPCGAERQQPYSCSRNDALSQISKAAGRITAKIASVRMRRFNLCADYFRSTPINKRSQCRPACLKGANSGSRLNSAAHSGNPAFRNPSSYSERSSARR